MYKVLEVNPPKFPEISKAYKLILDNDAASGRHTVIIGPVHKCVMADGTEKQVKELKPGDEIIMY